MKPVGHLLHRSVTEQFYRQHAGLFLFSFFILFGIQPSAADVLRFHYSIILSILDSFTFFGLAFLAWAVYTLKVIFFVRGCLAKEAYDVLYLLEALELRTRARYLATMVATMMAPVFIYGAAVSVTGSWKGSWLAGIAVMISILLLFIASLLIVLRLISNGKNNQLVRRKFRVPIMRPGLFSLVMQFVFRKQFITLLILKTVSFTALYFFARTDSQVFEGRMLWLLFMTVLVGHGIIIFRNFHFMENELAFYRNLPVSKWYTLLSLLAVYAILLIPEFWALKGIIFIQHNLQEYMWLLLTGPFVLLLIHSLLYSEDNKMEEFLALLFGIWVVFVFFSLSDNRWLMPAVGCVFGAVIFHLSYYRYERKADLEPDKKAKRKKGTRK